MADFYNAFEVFEMAEQIERNGGEFYRKAAEMSEDEELSGVLQQLATMEDDHIRVFSSLKEKLAGQEWAQGFDQENEAVLFLRAMASGKVFDSKKDPAQMLAGMSMAAVLDKAIGVEKDSIAFYTGIKELVPQEFGRERIDNIIKEEMRHVRILSERLAAMSEF